MKNQIYNDDVERVVNDAERQNAILASKQNQKVKEQRKILVGACKYAVFAIALASVGILGWLVAWIAFPAMAACSLYSAFCFGRWFENIWLERF